MPDGLVHEPDPLAVRSASSTATPRRRCASSARAPDASMITPNASLAFTRTATPLAAPAPLGGFRLIWPMTLAAFVEVVPVARFVPVVAGVVADCVLVAEAAAGRLEVCLLEDELAQDQDQRRPRSQPRRSRRPRGRSRRRAASSAGRWAAARGPARTSASVSAGRARLESVPRSTPARVLLTGALARAVPSGISGSGLLATLCSSEASTRAQARS